MSELREALRGKRVCMDTAPLIYYVEEHPDYYPFMSEVVAMREAGELEFVASVVLLGESLVHPLRHDNESMVAAYTAFIEDERRFKLMAVDNPLIKKAASFRAVYRLKMMDSIQLATAVLGYADIFLTNDKQLAKVREVDVWVLADKAAAF